MPSLLQEKRLAYQPPLPDLLKDLTQVDLIGEKGPVLLGELSQIFPKTGSIPSWRLQRKSGVTNRKLLVGVFFSGGQAPGGHNVLAGLYDALVEMEPQSQLIGFLDGPSGLVENRGKRLDKQAIDSARNQGGFDLIGSSRVKIETQEQFEAVEKAVRDNKLDALIVIGGDDSNTNAAFLAEYFSQKELNVSVIGIPKTIDGDLRTDEIEISFGFDSACKTYSELIGNIAKDALSARKYYHFIKLMGRSASHITLECALATRPNLALIGEEKRALSHIVQEIVELIETRKQENKHYGVILLPEGLIEFIPEIQQLITELNDLLSQGSEPQEVAGKLPDHLKNLFDSLPEPLQTQLLFDRDPHGNVQVSKIETEQFLLELVFKELRQKGETFHAVGHFFGYEGRSCMPSNFDANYCYALGRFAALACRSKATGTILAVSNLKSPVAKWQFKAIPIHSLIHFEVRSGKKKPVIAKALVDLTGSAYQQLAQEKEGWKRKDDYQMPGPIQFFGDLSVTDSVPLTL